jgi:hypothetical protein
VTSFCASALSASSASARSTAVTARSRSPAALHAAARFEAGALERPLVLLGTADEESGMDGMRALVAEGEEVRSDLDHPVERALAQRRIGGVPGPAERGDPRHHHALVHAHGRELGRLADDGVRAEGGIVREERPHPVHPALLVRRAEEHEGPLEGARLEARSRVERRSEEALHVSRAEAVVHAVLLDELEGVGRPARLVVGHGIRMAREHEPTFARADAGDEVRLVRRAREALHLGAKAHALGPFGEALDHRAVLAIPSRIGGAHGGRPDELAEHLLGGGQGGGHHGGY